LHLIDGKSITEDFREKIIIEFIRKYPYCNVEEVVEGVKNDISRVTVFKILHKLIENGAVRRYLESKQKRNNREHQLYVDKNNPFISVPEELEQFDNAYFRLFSKAIAEFDRKYMQAAQEWRTKHGLDPYDPDETSIGRLTLLLANLFYIFYSMVDTYLFRFLLKWSRTISDQQVLQKLYSIVFSKIADMQTRIFEMFKSTQLRGLEGKMIQPFIWERFGGSQKLIQYLEVFKEFDMQKEIEPVIDSLWKIIGDLQSHVYPEPQIYGLPFEYGKDDWRKLTNLLKQYPELTQEVWSYDDKDLLS
jgi:predicted transcriptional regulator